MSRWNIGFASSRRRRSQAGAHDGDFSASRRDGRLSSEGTCITGRFSRTFTLLSTFEKEIIGLFFSSFVSSVFEEGFITERRSQ